MNILTQPADAPDPHNIAWAIRVAQEKAYMNGDGYPSDKHLTDALAKHGLVIVEASKWDAATTALQLVGSYPSRYVPPMIRKAVAVAIKKMGM